ncbi:hypothetical protein K438DRAFT_1962383 [Mycena galopus ATCC 62051]|nr:hypothetical protein K438DRAFT_1962383 [Mycena galopus ATCC 62051]
MHSVWPSQPLILARFGLTVDSDTSLGDPIRRRLVGSSLILMPFKGDKAWLPNLKVLGRFFVIGACAALR